MGTRAQTARRLAAMVASVGLLWAVGAAAAQAAVAGHVRYRDVRYHGYTVTVPDWWPVYHLSRDPHVCVRFDRHAVYLGSPGSAQRCPAHAVGRTEAILLAPASRGRTQRSVSVLGPVAPSGRSTSFVVGSAGVSVTATWSREPNLIARALGRRSPPAAPGARPARRPEREAARPARRPGPRAARPAGVSADYAGLGFDACSAPSPGAMSAWSASPYRAIGVYIGGVNEACSQPNLTSSWVANEIAAGWHLILTYVGLQAPSNSCGCASITPSQASAQGTAAANDAVTDAQAIAVPAGNPIYFDMEAYPRGATNTSTVLSFLSAWTARLHALGYLSGVYSSGASGMTDLVNANATGFVEPDDIWFAEWNATRDTSSAYVPASSWSNHQRIHQYSGGHNETYGGVTINVDGDYLDGATADTSSATASSAAPLPAAPPALTVTPTPNGITGFSASWNGATGVTGWRVLGGESPTAMAGVGSARASGAVTHLTIRTSAPYFAVQALGSSNAVLGTSPAVSAPPHLTIYGGTAFVPGGANAVGGLPVGCYTGRRCRVSTQLMAGRTLVARTGAENVGAGSGGLVYFRLSAAGSVLLAHARSHRLRVLAAIRDSVSGQTASALITLIPFTASGRASVAHLTEASSLKVIGLTDFVWGVSGTGGILAGCMGVPLCGVTTTLSVGRVVIARTGPEMLGADELGYLFFSLTRQGRAMLARAPGGRLLARLTLATTSSSPAHASTAANIALVQYR
jgi:hypothetical protein